MRSLYTESRESLCAATDSVQQKKKKRVFPNFLTEMQPGAAQTGPASGQNKTILTRLSGDSTGVARPCRVPLTPLLSDLSLLF